MIYSVYTVYSVYRAHRVLSGAIFNLLNYPGDIYIYIYPQDGGSFYGGLIL
jgi:hypothetical protein